MRQETEGMLEEEAAGLRERQELIYVTNKCCQECVMFPGSLLSQYKEAAVQDCLKNGRFAECHYITIARWKGHKVPDYCCCYGFFYAYHNQIRTLKEALEDGRICYLAMDGLQGLRESGLKIVDPPGFL